MLVLIYFTLTLKFIWEFPMINAPPKINSIGFSYVISVRNSVVALESCVTTNHSLASTYQYMFSLYHYTWPTILKCTCQGVHEPDLACSYPWYACVLVQIVMHMSCAYTSALITSSILHAHTCMHMCKLQNVSCHVSLHTYLIKF